jgi:hypothetical protein
VFYGTVNANPVMFRLLKNRYHGGWVFWIGHRADGYGDQCGQGAEFPVDGRAALRTKKLWISPPLAAACVNSFEVPEMLTTSAG